MDLAILRTHLLACPGALEDYPFGPEPLVVKVGGKMFALVALTGAPVRVSLKCDPERARFLRDAFPAIAPGHHLSKRHWNTLTLDGTIPDDLVLDLIGESYRLVVRSLPKAVRATLGQA